MEENLLYYGDNLDVLRRYVKDESVDLVYLDPPFNSRQDYNVLFAEKDGSRPAEQKKGADRGIDGRIYFHDEANVPSKQVVLSVKSGKVGVGAVRDLRGVIERENAQIGVLITLQNPTRDMTREAAAAGLYALKTKWGHSHPRLQILTIEALLAGAQIDYPDAGPGNVTLKMAPKAKAKAPENGKLPL